MQRHLISVTYSPSQPLTDFYKVMQSQPENTLFLYNENVEQFLDKDDVSPGGGNGVMRMYRFDHPSHASQPSSSGSLGIPTMYLQHRVSNDSQRFTLLLGYIHQAFDQIHMFLWNNPRIQNIVWSSDEQLMLGMSIATRSGRISESQVRTIQDVVRTHMVTLMERFHIQSIFYGGHNSIHSHEFVKLLRIKHIAAMMS